VKNGKETDLSAKMFRVGGNRQQRIGSGTEENVLDDPLVLQGDLGNPLRYGKDDMKISNVKKFGLSVMDPLGARQGLAFWTVTVRTGVVPDALVAAPVTDLDVTAESGGAAHFNRCHHASLCRG